MAYLSNSLSAYPILNLADFLLATDKVASHSVLQCKSVCQCLANVPFEE
jgi:hypothetical protein